LLPSLGEFVGDPDTTENKGISMYHHTRSILKKRDAAVMSVRAGLVLAACTAIAGTPAAIGQASSTNGVAVSVFIDSLGMDSTLGSMVFISIGPPPYSTTGSKTGNPTCSTTGPGQWSFVLPLTTAIQQQMFTALLAAHNQGSLVTLVGSGKCDTYSTVETLTNIIV
jgi:hypothetical protein